MNYSAWISVLLVLVLSVAVNATTLDEIMTKHIEALGGSENLDRIESSRSVASISTAGMEGTATFTYKRPDKMRSDVDLPLAKMTRVIDGDDMWMTDLNGQPRSMSGEESREAITEIFLANGDYLKEEFRGTAVKYIADETVDGKLYHQLLIAPPDGLEMKLFIDSESYLIALSEARVQMFNVRMYSEDYRNVDGVMVAFGMRQETGVPMMDLNGTTMSHEFNVDVPDDFFKRPGEIERDWSIADGMNTSVDIDVRIAHIYVSVYVDGVGPFYFVLDSGAGITIIGKKVADSLNLMQTGELPAVGVGGVEAGSFVEVDSISVGGAVIRDLVAGQLDFSKLNQYAQQPIEGILGYDLFHRFAVEIDYYNSRLVIYSPDDSMSYAGADTLDLQIESNHAMVNAVINDSIDGRYRLDTGSMSYLDLSSDIVSAHGLIEASPSIMSGFEIRGVGESSIESTVGRLGSFSLGDAKLENIPCGFSTSEEGIFEIEGIDGNIGGRILSQFDCIFDYTHGRLLLTPNPDFNTPDSMISVGFSVLNRNGTFVVSQVIDGTSASDHGVAEGDVVMKIDGKLTEGMMLHEVTKLLQGGESSSVEVEIEHDGKRRNLKLDKKPLF